MMMKNLKTRIISIYILSILSAGCTETIDNIQLDSTRSRLVVEGYISTDTTCQMVKLSKLGDALMKDQIQVISNALITISDGSKIFNLPEVQIKKGTFFTTPDVFGVVDGLIPFL